MESEDLYESASRLAQAADDTLRHLSQRGRSTGRQLRHTAKRGWNDTRRLSGDAVDYAREHPAKVVGVALGVAAAAFAVSAYWKRQQNL